MYQKKVIKFVVREVYGNSLEYVASKGDAKIILGLTGQKTINGRVRELIRDLTGGSVDFERVPLETVTERWWKG